MALTITQIPRRYQQGLAKINALSIGAASTIADAIEKTSASSRKELIASVELAAQIPVEDAEAIIASLHSLYGLKASAEASIEEFVPVLIGAMQSSGNRDLKVPEERREELVTKLSRLLGLGSLEHASKIERLQADHQIIFYDAKILTDLRPLFDNPKEKPIGAVITHTLKIIRCVSTTMRHTA